MHHPRPTVHVEAVIHSITVPVHGIEPKAPAISTWVSSVSATSMVASSATGHAIMHETHATVAVKAVIDTVTIPIVVQDAAHKVEWLRLRVRLALCARRSLCKCLRFHGIGRGQVLLFRSAWRKEVAGEGGEGRAQKRGSCNECCVTALHRLG